MPFQVAGTHGINSESPKVKAKKRGKASQSAEISASTGAAHNHEVAGDNVETIAASEGSPARTKRTLSSFLGKKKLSKKKSAAGAGSESSVVSESTSASRSEKGVSSAVPTTAPSGPTAGDEPGDLVQLTLRTSCLDSGISSVCIQVTPATTCGDVLEDLVRQANVARKERSEDGVSAAGRRKASKNKGPLSYTDFCVCEVRTMTWNSKFFVFSRCPLVAWKRRSTTHTL